MKTTSFLYLLKITETIFGGTPNYRYEGFGYMEGINGLELSPKKTDYLKFIKEKKRAKTTEISGEFKP